MTSAMHTAYYHRLRLVTMIETWVETVYEYTNERINVVGFAGALVVGGAQVKGHAQYGAKWATLERD